MKPGGPFAWGFWKGKPVFCLPGNPVACFVTFAIFVRPAIMRLSGMDWRTDQRYNLPIAFDYPKKKGRREFVRVAVNPVTMMLEKVASQGSGIVTGLSLSHGLADFAETIAFAKTGDSIPFMPFSSLGLF
jgi:molybdopterin molybdotransferase